MQFQCQIICSICLEADSTCLSDSAILPTVSFTILHLILINRIPFILFISRNSKLKENHALRFMSSICVYWPSPAQLVNTKRINYHSVSNNYCKIFITLNHAINLMVSFATCRHTFESCFISICWEERRESLK